MREKLNSNPIAQVALIGVLIAGAAFFLLKGGGGESSAGRRRQHLQRLPKRAPPRPLGVQLQRAAPPLEGKPRPLHRRALQLLANPRAPWKPVKLRKRASGLGARPGGACRGCRRLQGTEDCCPACHSSRRHRRTDRQADGCPSESRFRKLAVFVIPAKQIARYTAITVGVEVEQVPALIVMRPRRLSGGTPQASVSYGFQTPESVVQAVADASYRGPEVPYHPN